MLCWVTISSRTFYSLPIHRSSWESHRHLPFIRTKTRDTHSSSLPLFSSPICPHLPIILLSWLKEETSQSACLPLAHPNMRSKRKLCQFCQFCFWNILPISSFTPPPLLWTSSRPCLSAFWNPTAASPISLRLWSQEALLNFNSTSVGWGYEYYGESRKVNSQFINSSAFLDQEAKTRILQSCLDKERTLVPTCPAGLEGVVRAGVHLVPSCPHLETCWGVRTTDPRAGCRRTHSPSHSFPVTHTSGHLSETWPSPLGSWPKAKLLADSKTEVPLLHVHGSC